MPVVNIYVWVNSIHLSIFDFPLDNILAHTFSPCYSIDLLILLKGRAYDIDQDIKTQLKNFSKKFNLY